MRWLFMAVLAYALQKAASQLIPARWSRPSVIWAAMFLGIFWSGVYDVVVRV